jgi:hypothetical protein
MWVKPKVDAGRRAGKLVQGRAVTWSGTRGEGRGQGGFSEASVQTQQRAQQATEKRGTAN